MFLDKIFFNPSDQMIFESPLYYLMKKIWCNELMYICPWESSCEWLYAQFRTIICPSWAHHTVTSITIPHVSHAFLLESFCLVSAVSLSDLLSSFPSPSKSSLCAKQLPQQCSTSIGKKDTKKLNQLHGAPSLNIAGYDALLWIVSNIWTKAKNGRSVFAICTFYLLWLAHSRF